MENLKAIIVFLLFWSIAIWCVRVVKRKHKKQIMKFSEELPEMELVTDEEERKYIYQSINGSGKFLTVLIVFVFLFNLWIMADEMKIIWKQWMNGVELDFWTFSGFGIMDWIIAEYLSTKIERKRICESGVVKKKIVHIKSYEKFDYGWPEGVIDGKERELRIDLSPDAEKPFKQDGDMAMLVWLENGENSLLPRMKPKDESNVGEE